MPYQFTSAEQAQIQAAQALCPQGAVATSTGNWVPFYTTLANILALGKHGVRACHSPTEYTKPLNSASNMTLDVVFIA